jgi:hypothetical protein
LRVQCCEVTVYVQQLLFSVMAQLFNVECIAPWQHCSQLASALDTDKPVLEANNTCYTLLLIHIGHYSQMYNLHSVCAV